MLRRQIIICNKLGLHARASTKLVNLAGRYGSKILLIRNDKTVNAKSIMGIMMLAASKGTEIELVVEGDDETDAMAAIVTLIENRFGEAE